MTRIAAVDATFLIELVDGGFADAGSAVSKGGKQDLEGRLALLLQEWTSRRTRLIIPAPAFAEASVRDPAKAQRLAETLRRGTYVSIAAFGHAAAIECADLMRRIHTKKAELNSVITRSKIKFDLQILAIARVANADALYVGDAQLKERARTEGMRAISFSDLPKPVAHQQQLPLAAVEKRRSGRRLQLDPSSPTDAAEQDNPQAPTPSR